MTLTTQNVFDWFEPILQEDRRGCALVKLLIAKLLRFRDTRFTTPSFSPCLGVTRNAGGLLLSNG